MRVRDNAMIGRQIRVSRLKKGMTLLAVSQATGIDKGFLSRLERGLKSPSISSLVSIAETIGVPVSTLVGDQVPENYPQLSRKNAPLSLIDREESGSIALISSNDHFSAFLVEHSDAFIDGGFVEHAGHEFIFCLEGALEVAFQNKTVRLEKGDSTSFPGHVQHRIRSLEESVAKSIILVCR